MKIKFKICDDDFAPGSIPVCNRQEVYKWSDLVGAPVLDGERDCFSDIQACKPDPLQKVFGKFLNPPDDEVGPIEERVHMDDLEALSNYVDFCDQQRELYNLDDSLTNKEVLEHVEKNLSDISNDWKNSGVDFETFVRRYVERHGHAQPDGSAGHSSIDNSVEVDRDSENGKRDEKKGGDGR